MVTDKSDNKIAFISVVFSKILIDTFLSSNKNIKKLSVGVLVAFNSAKRFNNYGIIAFEIDAPNKNTTLIDYIIKFNNIIEKKKKMAISTYIAGNVYNSNKSYGQIDILLSGFPMTKSHPMTINGIKLKSTKQNLNYHTQPIYCMFLSCDRFINLTIGMRTPDIDHDKLKKNLNICSF